LPIKVEVWGDYACFSRPEFKVERVSYDVITPSAARGLIEGIYYHSGLKWTIDNIYVLSPIQFTSVRRNEIKPKISVHNVSSAMIGRDIPLYISSKTDIQQRSSLILRSQSMLLPCQRGLPASE
jgi:CRISPR-associated protein Cas5d